MRRTVSSAVWVLSVLGIVMALGVALVYPLVPWPKVFNVSSPAGVAEAGPAVAVLAACIALSIPFGITSKIQIGLQTGYVTSLWEMAGNLLGLGLLLLAVRTQLGLPWLVAAIAGAPLATSMASAVQLFGRSRPWLRPSRAHWSSQTAKQILRLGGTFFLMQLCIAAAYSADNLIAAHQLGPQAVTQLAVPARLFTGLIVLAGLVTGPLWPAYAEASARGDHHWISRTLLRSAAIVSLFVSLTALPLALFGRPVIQAWAGAHVDTSPWLLAGLALWALLGSMDHVCGSFLNGLSRFRLRLGTLAVLAVVSLPLKLLFAARFGVEGIVWAGCLAYAGIVGVPSIWYLFNSCRHPQPRLLSTAGSTATFPVPGGHGSRGRADLTGVHTIAEGPIEEPR